MVKAMKQDHKQWKPTTRKIKDIVETHKQAHSSAVRQRLAPYIANRRLCERTVPYLWFSLKGGCHDQEGFGCNICDKLGHGLLHADTVGWINVVSQWMQV